MEVLFLLLGGWALYELIDQFVFVVSDYHFAFLWFILMMLASGMIQFPTLLVSLGVIAAGLSLVVDPPGRTA